MNGDALYAKQPPSPPSPPIDDKRTNKEIEAASGWNSGSTKRAKRKGKQQAPRNRLSVESSTGSSGTRDNRHKPVRARPKKEESSRREAETATDDPETSSLFTTTSEITTDDDAASIEIRLKQLVVEQEEKLNLDDRYRSTPVLAHRLLHTEGGGEAGDQGDCNRKGVSNQHGVNGNAPNLAPLKGVRAKSANDLLASPGVSAFNLDNSATDASRVPDVFVVQADEVQQQGRGFEETASHFDGNSVIDREEKFAEQEEEWNNNVGCDDTPQRARALSVASPPTGRHFSIEQDDGANESLGGGGSMRRNASSSLLPERGNLRTLNSIRHSGGGELAIASSTAAAVAVAGRNRSNTAGSMDKSALFGIGSFGAAAGGVNGYLAGDEQADSMLSIRRSAWTLSDFDQTFNKSALAEQQRVGDGSVTSAITSAEQQQQQSKMQQQFSAISDTPRGSTASDRHSTSLLIKASKNAMASLNNNQQQQGQQQQPQEANLAASKAVGADGRHCLNVMRNPIRDRRSSFSHSIVSIPSSVDSYNPASKLSPFNDGKHRPSFAAAGADDAGEDQKGSCLKSCCNLATLRQYLPILEWLPNYKLNTFYSDLGAGLAVAALNISTSLSAAVVAETDFGAAFRASIVNTFVYAILCSSRHASFGSWSIMSQMLLLSVKRALNDEFILDRLNMGPSTTWEPEEYEKWHMNIIIMYTFLIGLVQLICGALNLGNILSSFIPEALCSSMIAATAFTMAIGQLANMCGTSNKILWQIERNTTELWADLKNPPVDITDLFANTFRWIQQIILLAKHCDQINAACVIISFISVILLFLNQYVIQRQLQRLFNRKILIPFEMVLLVVMILVSYSLDLAGSYNVATCGPISIDFGIPNIPNLKLIRELWFNSLATALISYTMVYIMAKSYSNKLNYEVNYNQELLACGAGNLIGGLFDALPATASFSRTAGQVEAGGQTQMVSIINCFLLVVLARLLGHHVSVLPICVMSAALFYGFCRMMTRFTEVFMYWRVCKVDCAIWVVTFVAILAVDMVNGFIFGFIFSILTMLYRAQNRRCYMLGTIGSSEVYVPLVKYPMAQEIEGIKIFQFCGPIHYVCADLVERLLRQKTRVNVKEVLRYISDQGVDKFDPRDLDLPTHIILDFSMISFIDSAGIHVIKKIIEDYQKINVTIFLASLASHVAAVVKSEPALWNVYKQRFYITVADAVHCAVRDRMKQRGPRCEMYA